jgi:putative ABC transport system permease protein
LNPLLLIAVRNVTLNWRHSLASLLSITAAFFSLNIFQGYIHDLGNLYYVSYRNRSMLGDLIIENRDGDSAAAKADPEKFQITAEMQATLQEFNARHADLIQASARFLNVQGSITNGGISTIFLGRGYDATEGAKIRGALWNWDALYGEPLSLHTEGGVMLVGQSLGITLGCTPDPKVRAATSDGGYQPVNRPFKCTTPSMQLSSTTENGQLSAIDLTPVGIIDAGYVDIDRKYVSMNLSDAQKLLDTKSVTFMTLLLSGSDRDIEAVKADFAREVEPKFPELHVVRWQDHPTIGDLYNRSMDLLGIFRNFVVIVIISISTLSVLNTMTKSLSERTREVGTMLSIGFRARHMRVVFLTESVLLCAIGLFIGGVGSLVVEAVVNRVGILYKAGLLSEPVPFRISLDARVAALSIFGLLALSSVATLVALSRVLRKRIVDCLHYV